MTHSLEVAQIARSVCRCLRLNEDLGEALALAHDLGHPPFGHAGEDALRDMMEPFGGFDHNAQSLRVVTFTGSPLRGFRWFGSLLGNAGGNRQAQWSGDRSRSWAIAEDAVAEYAKVQDLELDTFAGAEAQIASLSDDIAYNNHDIDDGLRAGLFSIGDLKDVPLAGPVFHEVNKRHPGLDDSRVIHEAVRSMIGSMVRDLLVETSRRLKDCAAQGPSPIFAP